MKPSLPGRLKRLERRLRDAVLGAAQLPELDWRNMYITDGVYTPDNTDWPALYGVPSPMPSERIEAMIAAAGDRTVPHRRCSLRGPGGGF